MSIIDFTNLLCNHITLIPTCLENNKIKYLLILVIFKSIEIFSWNLSCFLLVKLGFNKVVTSSAYKGVVAAIV